MSSVINQLIARIRECQKQNLPQEMNTLKTVYGEIELIRSRNTKKFTDEDAIKVFKKFKVGVEECISELHKHGSDATNQMHDEILVYEQFIPATMSVGEINDHLRNTIIDELGTAKSIGQAIGLAMGQLKMDGMSVDGKDVATVVREMLS